MTLRTLPPIPDASAWTQGGLQQPGLEYVNELARVIGEYKTAIETLETQAGQLAAGLDDINVEFEQSPSHVWLGTKNANSGSSVSFDVEAGVYSKLEIFLDALSPSGISDFSVGIDDAGGGSYTDTVIATSVAAAATLRGKVEITRVSTTGANKLVHSINTDAHTLTEVSETGAINAVRISCAAGFDASGKLHLYGII